MLFNRSANARAMTHPNPIAVSYIISSFCHQGPLAAYDEYGLRQLHLPTVDYSPPTLEQLHAGVDYLADCIRNKEPVYVHCKAGQVRRPCRVPVSPTWNTPLSRSRERAHIQGRSATLVLCFLIVQRGWTVQDAQTYLQAKRPRISRDIYTRPIVAAFVQTRADPPTRREDGRPTKQ